MNCTTNYQSSRVQPMTGVRRIYDGGLYYDRLIKKVCLYSLPPGFQVGVKIYYLF